MLRGKCLNLANTPCGVQAPIDRRSMPRVKLVSVAGGMTSCSTLTSKATSTTAIAATPLWTASNTYNASELQCGLQVSSAICLRIEYILYRGRIPTLRAGKWYTPMVYLAQCRVVKIAVFRELSGSLRVSPRGRQLDQRVMMGFGLIDRSLLL
jgi:hypothetical protein